MFSKVRNLFNKNSSKTKAINEECNHIYNLTDEKIQVVTDNSVRAFNSDHLVSFKSKHPNNIYYSESAHKLFENVEDNLRKHIKSINIEYQEHAGLCSPTKVNGEYEINITIKDRIDGIDIIENYNVDYLKKFNEVLDHELVHAITFAQLIESKELDSISNDKLASLGLYVLDEYNACRKIAERYNSFELSDGKTSIDDILDIAVIQLRGNLSSIFTNVDLHQNAKDTALYKLRHVLYAVATRCAFASVSSVHKNLISTKNEILENFISRAQELLVKGYMEIPLNKDSYYILGKSLLLEYLATIPPIGSSIFKLIEESPDFEKKLLDVI